MIDKHLYLLSEQKELKNILAEIPKENIIERLGFEARLKDVEEQLKNISINSVPQKAKITFRGEPVFGTHGIYADFATNAIAAFSDAFSAVLAGLTEKLNYMGPIPNREKNQLLITGTAIGSFGFEMELPAKNENAQQELFPVQDNAEIALEKIQELFKLTANGTDDELSELIDEIHPRAVRKVADFLNLLLINKAWCGLDFNEKYFKYSGIEQIQIASDRLKEENIKTSQEPFQGVFLGVLPKGRTFEFALLKDNKNVIRGKIGLQIENPSEINRIYLEQPVNALFSIVQVGQGRPKYTLEKLDDIQKITESTLC